MAVKMQTFDEGYMNTHKTNSGYDLSDNSLKDNLNTDDGTTGTTSDYILIAMIVGMMFCMTICCLCLFCRSSSHCMICGFNFEMTNRTASIAIDDLSELHEVVPLTPTVTADSLVPDIENILCNDPPPPKYSEVANTSMRDRFRWKSRRKKTPSGKDKMSTDSSSRKTDSIVRGQSKRGSSGKRSSSQSMFQRSISYQHPRITSLRSSTTGTATLPDKKVTANKSMITPTASYPQHATLPANPASDIRIIHPCTKPDKIFSIGDKVLDCNSGKSEAEIHQSGGLEVPKDVQGPEQTASSESYDDDEVFI